MEDLGDEQSILLREKKTGSVLAIEVCIIAYRFEERELLLQQPASVCVAIFGW